MKKTDDILKINDTSFEEIKGGNMPRKKRESSTPFGAQLAKIRKLRGLTQKKLGEMIGASPRMMTYYEKETQPPPSAKLHSMAKALNVTTDELLGIKDIKKSNGGPINKRVSNMMKTFENLSNYDQKVVIHFVNALVAKDKLKQTS